MTEIIRENVEGLCLVKEDEEEWYAFELESGTVIWFRETEDGVMETRVEQ